MKTVFRIFGILAILISLLTCGLSISRSADDKEDLAKEMTEAKAQIAKAKEQAAQTSGETKAYMDGELAKVEKKMNEGPSESTYLIIEIFLSVLLLLALAFGVFLFRPNLKLVTQLIAAAAVVTVVTYFMSPDIQRGEYSGMNSRTLVLVSGIPVIIAGLFAFLVAKRSVVKQ